MRCIKGTQASTEIAPNGPKIKKFEQQNKGELDYDPKLKINIHEFMLI